MNIEQLLGTARAKGASDIHISEGQPLMLRIRGRMTAPGLDLSDEEVVSLIHSLMDEGQREAYGRGLDVDFAFTARDGRRQRVNIFRQRGSIAAVIRLLNDDIPDMEQLRLPVILKELVLAPRGLILVTGPTGSGKSTTLASMIDYLNRHTALHIITIEDPIEYIHKSRQALIHQREVGRDTASFDAALHAALREDPDIILLGEMRSFETISAALTAAETGHLVFSTLHTTGAARTIDRIIDACPGQIHAQIRTQLAGSLAGIITQSLLPLADQTGRVPATEVLIGTDAIRNLIRENKIHQITSAMQSGAASGMHTLNMDLARLAGRRLITREAALACSDDPGDLQQYLEAG